MRERTRFKQTGWFDYLIVIICLCFLAIFGVSFGFLLLSTVSLVVIVFRRIDLRKHYVIRRLLVVGLVVIGASFVIVESFVISELKTNVSGKLDADYVVVLGSGLKEGNQLSQTLQMRLDASLSYVMDHSEIPIIVSGGQGPDEDLSEAEAMRNYLVHNGISQQRIILENKSTSTEENLLFSKAILTKQGINHPKIIIITSDYHMFRAKLIAKKMDYVAYGISSKSPIRLKPIAMIREYFATIKTFL